ncbi:class I SAM-dependent methyltransferase [Streptomyces sp. MST-110588]|uniref:class I SAM-dependent methyltransferase n=1 Tax=Streptomyces sp. MST-110588 TaxID=2833628 RepID=UPI001F5CDF69|nr:class I SAM-dependent methyltransferase [Streptomyces sp. MST-110588]UNO44230.1 class I SAM-dependent methyltransferase [Streptomyces sp. MST-110588]
MSAPAVPPTARHTVRQELLSRQLDEQIAARFPVGQRLEVLGVGLGEGFQALRLARAGHKVTGLEPDPAMLDVARTVLSREPEGIQERVRLIQGDGGETGVHFLPGTFDIVLCHGVLMDAPAPDPDPLLAGLARMLAPGGLLSLVVRNADAPAMRPGLDGDWERALTAFESADARYRLDALTTTLAGIGAPLHTWYGVQVFTGHSEAGDPASASGEGPVSAEGPVSGEGLERLLAAEDRAARTDPYRAVAELLHLCGVRG